MHDMHQPPAAVGVLARGGQALEIADLCVGVGIVPGGASYED